MARVRVLSRFRVLSRARVLARVRVLAGVRVLHRVICLSNIEYHMGTKNKLAFGIPHHIRV